jgi:hypothetical protein
MLKGISSLLILVISIACTIKGQDYQSFPLREFKRKLSPEGKLTYPFTDRLVSHFHYFTEKDKKSYKLIYDQNQTMSGFSVTNNGSNEVVESSYKKGKGPRRIFKWMFAERAIQDNRLEIIEKMTDSEKDERRSILMFFPRTYIPSILFGYNTIEVTMSNGERVFFKKDEKTILPKDSIFREVSAQEEGEFANLRYIGDSVILRLDLTKPFKKSVATILHKNMDSPCFIKASYLFDFKIRMIFKFHNDEEFYDFVMDTCDLDEEHLGLI